MKKCMYCSRALELEHVIDICVPCGHGVWGENMFRVICKNMETARTNGDLEQGSVTSSSQLI